MASGTINRPVFSRVVSINLEQPTYWEIVQANVREASGALVGSIILKCITDTQSNSGIVKLDVTPTAYAFIPAMVTNSQWDYVTTRVLRAYYTTQGYVTINAPFTSGEYVTISFSVGLIV